MNPNTSHQMYVPKTQQSNVQSTNITTQHQHSHQQQIQPQPQQQQQQHQHQYQHQHPQTHQHQHEPQQYSSHAQFGRGSNSNYSSYGQQKPRMITLAGMKEDMGRIY